MGECDLGYFGLNCSQSCPGCVSNDCDKIDGSCNIVSGCETGYVTGPYCDQECDDWYFGMNCTNKCNCLKEVCKKSNGKCSAKGCQKGWYGFACNKDHKITLTTEDFYINVDSAQDSATPKPSLASKKEIKTKGIEVIDAYQEEHEEEEEGNVYYNIPSEQSIIQHKIPIADLKKVIIEKRKEDGFKNEYEFLPKGLAHVHTEGSKEENKVKNRFLTTWPCPKKNTIKDFWQMVWQEKVGKIVMVTKLEEERRKKCEQYWPKTVHKATMVDNFRLTMTEEQYHTVYVYRLIIVHNKTKKQERQVHHYHFTEWPDHGVPDSVKLVKFYRKVKSKKCDVIGPMVVHCSAGVGRTGTFIAVDALYENSRKVGIIDVFEYVQMMRKDRMNMIQTHEQYEVVFEALLELLTVPDTSIQKNDFCGHIQNQDNKTLPKNRTMYSEEFQGYAIGSKVVVTQCPLVETVIDFWTMIYDHGSRIIVLLDPGNTDAPLWLEKKEMLQFDDFRIIKETENAQEELHLTLHHTKSKEQISINVFTANEWNITNAPPPPEYMIDLLQRVKTCWETQKVPITVVCSDGCSKSGLFVALKLILEKMQIDEEIDIFQVVRELQTRRPEFLVEFDQYEFCYKCVRVLLEEDPNDSL
ncbi:Hypothetical predicted protein, partial [Mytilus galloprovincialis]